MTAARKRSSGTHPAVVAFHDKVKEIEERDRPRVRKLNGEIQQYLDELRGDSARPPANGDRDSAPHIA